MDFWQLLLMHYLLIFVMGSFALAFVPVDMSCGPVCAKLNVQCDYL